MAGNMNGLLLDDRWAPITSEIGFLETQAEHAARSFVAWQAGLETSRGFTIEARPVSGSLEHQARRVKDRFTLDILKDYLHHLGLSPFSEDFYLPEGAPAWLVEKAGPTHANHKEFTLAEARKDF